MYVNFLAVSFCCQLSVFLPLGNCRLKDIQFAILGEKIFPFYLCCDSVSIAKWGFDIHCLAAEKVREKSHLFSIVSFFFPCDFLLIAKRGRRA